MTTQRTVIAALILAAGSALGACGRNERADVKETTTDEQRRAGMLVFADSAVLKAMRSPAAPGRIIYDKPTDLSIANAQRTRPDLVKPDTTRRDTSSVARRDTTAGDATADTSGGAARRRRP